MSTSVSSVPLASPAATGEARFPARVEHEFGITTVPSEPKRIVVVGLTEQDTVLALGYQPVATTEWYDEQPHAVWPWARDELGDAKPTVLKVKDDYSKAAAGHPQFTGKTATFSQNGFHDGLLYVYPPGLNTEFLTMLGFEINPRLEFISPLSLPYVLERLTPQLEAAVAGKAPRKVLEG